MKTGHTTFYVKELSCIGNRSVPHLTQWDSDSNDMDSIQCRGLEVRKEGGSALTDDVFAFMSFSGQFGENSVSVYHFPVPGINTLEFMLQNLVEMETLPSGRVILP